MVPGDVHRRRFWMFPDASSLFLVLGELIAMGELAYLYDKRVARMNWRFRTCAQTGG